MPRAVKDLSVPPCPKLQHLSLHACKLDLTGCSSAFCSRISTATALTSLHINKCTVDVDGPTTEVLQAETAQLLSALTPLTALQELSMCCVFAHASHATSYGPGPSAHLLLPTTVLQPLQHLTQLHLQVLPSTDGVVQHIGSMTDLQDLRLRAINEGTVLQLTTTQLTALTKLRRLGLQGVSLWCGTPAEAAANVAALLAWLPRLQELSSLQLRDVVGLVPAPQSYNDSSSDDDSSPDVAPYPPPSAYSALTAGSALQHIDLRATWISRSVWQHAFPLRASSHASRLCGFTSGI
jgi:hypothetical protein